MWSPLSASDPLLILAVPLKLGIRSHLRRNFQPQSCYLNQVITSRVLFSSGVMQFGQSSVLCGPSPLPQHSAILPSGWHGIFRELLAEIGTQGRGGDLLECTYNYCIGVSPVSHLCFWQGPFQKTSGSAPQETKRKNEAFADSHQLMVKESWKNADLHPKVYCLGRIHRIAPSVSPNTEHATQRRFLTSLSSYHDGWAYFCSSPEKHFHAYFMIWTEDDKCSSHKRLFATFPHFWEN